MLCRGIKELLKEKAVILVTHQRQFLRFSDEVIFISKVRYNFYLPSDVNCILLK